jgi:hypothetical protein
MLLFRRGCEQPLRPELWAVLGRYVAAQAAQRVVGRSGGRLLGAVAVLRCCTSALTPCLQIAVIARVTGAHLGGRLSVYDRDVPLGTGVNGTLMARRSWRVWRSCLCSPDHPVCRRPPARDLVCWARPRSMAGG